MAERTTMTITRALVKLNTLESRIEKTTKKSCFITFQCGSEENPREKITENSFQSINDLIDYRDKVQSAINRSNATTEVRIGDKTYTVAEALSRKRNIGYKKALLSQMKSQLGNVKQTVEIINSRVQDKLDGMIEKSFSGNQKSNAEEIRVFSEGYLKSNRAEVIDPMELADKIDKLEDEITEFLAEVDLVLSESNATTEIAV